jgi:hypothetical protein
MADRGTLEAAVAAGVLNADQVGPLRDFLAARASGALPAPSGEEDLRFIRNFHDVFLAIGILLFAIGLAIGIGTYVSGAENPRQGAVLTGACSAGAASLMWLLGEFFARRRRLFLPAIAIVMALTGFAVVSAATLYTGLLLDQGDKAADLDIRQMPPEFEIGILLTAAFAIIAPAAFYARFRLPFSLGMTGAGVALFVVVLGLVIEVETTLKFLPALFLALGALLFLAGVGFDARDPARTTRLSDNGFWLHFAAAPMILSGAFGLVGRAFAPPGEAGFRGIGGLLGAAGSDAAAAQAAVTLVIVGLIALVSLLINRRALIVSALLTTGIAIGVLMNAVGMGEGALMASTLITLGAFVLILGAGWRGVRRALLGWVKPGGVWARIFPHEASD